MRRKRRLAIVLGDQLDAASPVFHGFDPAGDVVWMAEVREESTHVPSTKMRIALFLTAMRHFAAELQARGIPMDYRRLDDPSNRGSLELELAAALERHRPERVQVVQPGDWRVLQALQRTAAVEVLPDPHFYCSLEEFRRHVANRKQLRLEYFYREKRKKHKRPDGWRAACRRRMEL
jgi:Uncharacterized protein related to deoxyribodipyrimidine photolyase